MWQEIQAIIAYKATPTLYDNNPHHLNDLNESFCRFATDNTSAIKASLHADEKALNLNADDVWENTGKSECTENIPGWVLLEFILIFKANIS